MASEVRASGSSDPLPAGSAVIYVAMAEHLADSVAEVVLRQSGTVTLEDESTRPLITTDSGESLQSTSWRPSTKRSAA